MSVPIDELKYAETVAIPLIDAVYNRYTGSGHTSVPGITAVADIHADTGKFEAMRVSPDPRTQVLLHAAFASGRADASPDGMLFGTLDRDPATNTGFVVFRGTKNFAEWIDDFLFPPVPFTEVGGSVPQVHDGFHKVYDLVRQPVLSQLHLLAGCTRIMVTGHSLGAAVATLCALDLANQKPLVAPVECWTFASPRVFFASTSRFNHDVPQSLRVENPLDVVTHVPSIVQGYFHVAGGFGIAPKLADFHSLDLTYAPGIQAKIDAGDTANIQPARVTTEQVSSEKAQGEDDQLRAMMALPR